MAGSSTEWLVPPKEILLSENEIHLWRARLDCPHEDLERFRTCLSPDEREKASSFYFEQHRDHYAAGRGILRDLLSRYLGIAATEIRFGYNDFGKPAVNGLQFNLAHSHDLALYAFSLKHQLGVDLEKMRPELANEEIADRFFSREEARALKNSGIEGFFRCWTRKEAFVKAHGKGLSLPLDKFTVDVGKTARLLTVESDPTEVNRWAMYSLDAGAGYAAALAAEGKNHVLKYWDWNPV